MGIESVVNIDIFNENRPRNINFMHFKRLVTRRYDIVVKTVSPIKYKLEEVSFGLESDKTNPSEY